MLTEAQRRIAEGPDDATLNAGPGAGKTRVLAAKAAHAIASGEWPGHRMVALTYTSMMAARLREQIEASLPEAIDCPACKGSGRLGGAVCGECGEGKILASAPIVGTLHGFAARVVGMVLRGQLAGLEVLRASGWIQGESFGIAIPEDVDDLIASAYKVAKRRGVTKTALREGLRLRGEALASWPTEAAARQELARRGLLTYADLIELLEEIAAVRPYRVPADGDPPTLGEAFPFLLVDEGQDLTARHWNIIDRWSPEALFVAGDDGQEIFGFLARREAQPEGVATFSGRLRGAEGLGENHRSGPGLVAFCDALRAALSAEGLCSDLRLSSACEASARAWTEASVVSAEDEGGIATGGACVSELLFAGFDPHEIAVLARSWKELEEAAALLELEEIPFALPRRSRDRWKTIAGRGFLALARHSAGGLLDELGARTLLEALGVGAPLKVAERCAHVALQRGVALSEALDADRDAGLLVPEGWWAAGAGAESLGDLLELTRAVEGHAGPAFVEAAEEAISWKGPGWPAEDWLLWLASPENQASVELEEGRVALTTIHGAKGLEWPAVVLLGACDGNFPGPRDKGEIGRGDAARALYVGATRAKEALRVVVPQLLRGKPRTPAPWLEAAGLMNPPA